MRLRQKTGPWAIRRRYGSFGVAAAVAIMASAAQARTLYVNNVTGDDRAVGNRPAEALGVEGPVRTIGKALRLAGPGDRVVVANTGIPYEESLTLSGWQHRGDGVHPFVLDGQGAVLDGTGPIPSEVWQPVAGTVFRYRPTGRTHWQLFAGGQPLVRRPADLLVPDPPTLTENEWCLHRGFVYFRAAPARYVSDYHTRHSIREVGITLCEVRDVVVQDLVVQGFRLDGINAKNDARRVVLAGLTCRGNGRGGVAVEGSSQVALGASLIGDNATAQVLVSGPARVTIERCELLERSAPAVVETGEYRVTRDGQEVPRAGGDP